MAILDKFIDRKMGLIEDGSQDADLIGGFDLRRFLFLLRYEAFCGYGQPPQRFGYPIGQHYSREAGNQGYGQYTPAMRRRLLAGKGICMALRIRFMVKKAEAREKAVMITGRDTSNLKRTFLVISFGA